MRIVPLTADMIGPDMPKSLRGRAAINDDGSVWATCGVYVSKCAWMMIFKINQRPCNFSFQQKRVLVRGFREVIKLVENSCLPVQAVADESIPRSEAFLTHLGFVPLSNRVYQWLG